MSLWGHLENRYSTQQPRKLLALDGGGIRGVMTLQVLIKMEDMLREQSGQGENFRLCNYFDYIGVRARARSLPPDSRSVNPRASFPTFIRKLVPRCSRKLSF